MAGLEIFVHRKILNWQKKSPSPDIPLEFIFFHIFSLFFRGIWLLFLFLISLVLL